MSVELLGVVLGLVALRAAAGTDAFLRAENGLIIAGSIVNLTKTVGAIIMCIGGGFAELTPGAVSLYVA